MIAYRGDIGRRRIVAQCLDSRIAMVGKGVEQVVRAHRQRDGPAHPVGNFQVGDGLATDLVW